MKFELCIRSVKKEDAFEIVDIYNYYINQSVHSSEETELNTVEMLNRIKEYTSKEFPWIVITKIYEDHTHELIGYCYLSPWRPRSTYRYTAESSIYLKYSETGKGYGKELYKTLIDIAKNKKEYHSIIGVVSSQNISSIKLHQDLGFEHVGTFREVSRKFNQWISKEFWQLIITDSEIDPP
jgi:phosphinothricin acetyltransferase